MGRVGDITIDQARAMARAKVLDYEDPAYMYRLAEEKARQSFAQVYEQYKAVTNKWRQYKSESQYPSAYNIVQCGIC